MQGAGIDGQWRHCGWGQCIEFQQFLIRYAARGCTTSRRRRLGKGERDLAIRRLSPLPDNVPACVKNASLVGGSGGNGVQRGSPPPRNRATRFGGPPLFPPQKTPPPKI